MLQPFLNGLNMAVHHGAVGADAKGMGCLDGLYPLCRGGLFRADFPAHPVTEDFRAAPRQGGQACRLQNLQHLPDGFAGHLAEMHDFHRGKCLDVRLRQCRPDLPHHVQVIVKVLGGMQGTDNVDFPQVAHPFGFLQYPGYILCLQHKAPLVPFLTLKGTQGATRCADIGQVDMPVYIIKNALAAFALLHLPRTCCQKQQIVILIESQRIFQGKPLTPLCPAPGCLNSLLVHKTSYLKTF